MKAPSPERTAKYRIVKETKADGKVYFYSERKHTFLGFDYWRWFGVDVTVEKAEMTIGTHKLSGYPTRQIVKYL